MEKSIKYSEQLNKLTIDRIHELQAEYLVRKFFEKSTDDK
jgi:hypothetical protein